MPSFSDILSRVTLVLHLIHASHLTSTSCAAPDSAPAMLCTFTALLELELI